MEACLALNELHSFPHNFTLVFVCLAVVVKKRKTVYSNSFAKLGKNKQNLREEDALCFLFLGLLLKVSWSCC
jgi:hypothetical protein